RWRPHRLAGAPDQRQPASTARRQRPKQLRVHMKTPTRLRSIVLAILAMLALGDAALAQGTRLLRRPAVSRELVAFEYGGDLWTVPRNGGQARRLTSTPNAEIDPKFSPDGSRIAFTATVGGNTDVYVV